MIAKRLLLGAAFIATPYFAACNYTVGECYPRGQGDGDTGAGAGVVTSGAGGGSGDTPPKEPQDFKYTESQCNAPEDDSVEASLKVFCTTPEHGVACAERCAAKGIACGPIAYHPYKSNGGTGKLFSCNDLIKGWMCGYHYPNGDDCYFPIGLPLPKVCSYSGN